jgi:hypothetical protein
MKTKFYQISASLAISALLIPVNANANKIKSFEVTPVPGYEKAPKITVYSSNGETYNKIDATKTSRARVRAKMQCKYGNNFGNADKAYDAKLELQGHAATTATDPQDGTSLWAIGKNGQGQVSRTFRWSGGNGAPNFAKICNSEVQKRLSEQPGKTKYHIMAKGFNVNYPAGLQARLRFTCKPTGAGFTEAKTKSTLINTQIVCQSSALAETKIPKPKPKPKRAKIVSMVEQVSFSSDRKDFSGKCPTKVSFTGTIKARRKGEVKYRFIKHGGKTSGTYTMNFNGPGTKSVVPWGTTVAQPKTGQTIAAYDTSNKPYNKTGFYRLEVQDLKGKLKTVKAPYSVTCIPIKKTTIVRPLKPKKPNLIVKPQ